MTVMSLREEMKPMLIMTSFIITGIRRVNTPSLLLIFIRYQSKGTLTCHHGSCHCGRVKFRLFAPKVLTVVDCGNTKLRFARFSTKHEFFETVTGEDCVSHYAVHNENTVGIYVFCSYCSVHILYAPHINPVEVQVNVECLEKSTIDDIIVAYHAPLETMPYSDSDRQYNKRGRGGSSSEMSLQLVWNLLHSYYNGDSLSPVKSPDPRRKDGAISEYPSRGNDAVISPNSTSKLSKIIIDGNAPKL